jgi:hypothetical protein
MKMIRSIFQLALISISLLTFVGGDHLTAFDQPNVVIIYSDDHGYTDLGIHGIDGNVDTPNMDCLHASKPTR